MSRGAGRAFPLQNEAVVNESKGIKEKLMNGLCVSYYGPGVAKNLNSLNTVPHFSLYYVF